MSDQSQANNIWWGVNFKTISDNINHQQSWPLGLGGGGIVINSSRNSIVLVIHQVLQVVRQNTIFSSLWIQERCCKGQTYSPGLVIPQWRNWNQCKSINTNDKLSVLVIFYLTDGCKLLWLVIYMFCMYFDVLLYKCYIALSSVFVVICQIEDSELLYTLK